MTVSLFPTEESSSTSTEADPQASTSGAFTSSSDTATSVIPHDTSSIAGPSKKHVSTLDTSASK